MIHLTGCFGYKSFSVYKNIIISLYFYFLKNLTILHIKNDNPQINDNKHGMIEIIIIVKGDISIQSHGDISSSVIFAIYIYK